MKDNSEERWDEKGELGTIAQALSRVTYYRTFHACGHEQAPTPEPCIRPGHRSERWNIDMEDQKDQPAQVHG